MFPSWPLRRPLGKYGKKCTGKMRKSLCENDVECRITTDRYTCIELPGEFLERRGGAGGGVLSSAACFVTYRRLPAYKKPNGGGSNLPPYNPLVHPSARPHSTSSAALSRPPSAFHLPSPCVLCETPAPQNGGGPDRHREPAHRRGRDRITPLSVLTAKTRNWGTM